MERILQLLRGFRGHPIHPPLTDIPLGAFTITAILVVISLVGYGGRRMVDAAFLTLVVGLIASVPTALTGWVDYVRIDRGTPWRRTALIHWVSMVVGVAVLLVAGALMQSGYDTGTISPLAAIVTLLGWALLLFGGWAGGAIVFVYGMRVLNKPETPTSEAISIHFPPD